MSRIYKEVYSSDIQKEETEKVDIDKMLNFFYFLFESDKITDELPNLVIMSGLNANVRCGFNKTKFEPNDFDDFRHATSSIPYYNYFFTENSLSHILNNKPTNYAQRYSTIVKSKPDDILTELIKLDNSNSV